MLLRFLMIAAAIILLAAIATCALSPSSYMTEISFIPTWLGTWADANPNFRNFPVFAALAALLFFVFSLLPSAFYSSVKLKFQPFGLQTALRAAVCASALGVLLEAAQLLLPGRWADPVDVMWMTLGAFAGALITLLLTFLLSGRHSKNATTNGSSSESVAPHS
ncbi:MAG: VanZ family protein [Chthoniobacterales bacterium]